MKRFVLHFSFLVLTFSIGICANALVLRAAYYFIPDYDYDPQPNPHAVIVCGLKSG